MHSTQKKFIHRGNSRSVANSLLLVMMMWVTMANAADCSYDYSPCTCYNNFIYCSHLPMAKVATAFQSKPAMDIYGLNLDILPEGDSIPEDLLGQSRIIGELMIYGHDSILIVDPNAFRSSRNLSLSYVELKSLDTSQMDFDFLADFPSVNSMSFYYMLNLDRSLPTLPYLPALADLFFYKSSDMDKAFNDSVLKCNGLKSISFHLDWAPQLKDEGMSALMNWLLPSSANTLERIYFSNNSTSLTRTPPQLGSFKNMTDISIHGNAVNMTISAGSIFSNPYMSVNIPFSLVVSVEEGAFLGNYTGFSPVRLNNNLLTRFEAGAFKTVLEKMVNSPSYVLVSDNPFDCYTDPCHLAWITRDNRYLMKYVQGARCNGTGEYFAEMSSKYFKKCNAAMLCSPHMQLCLSLITILLLMNYWRS